MTHCTKCSFVWVILFTLHLAPALLVGQNRRDRDAEEALVEADNLFIAKDFKSSKKLYEKALKADQRALAALRGLSKVAIQFEDWGDVKKWNRKILEVEPEDQLAAYNLGIAYRETGKFKALMLRGSDFGNSEKYFESVVARDSAFQDIILQQAILERYRDNWPQAIALGHAQVRNRPDLPAAYIGLASLYRGYLQNANETEYTEWLEGQHGLWARYFLGEQFRLQRKFAEAVSIFESMLVETLRMPQAPVLLSLVKLHAEQGDEVEASKYYWQAVENMQSDIDAQFLFEDAKYICKDSELNEFAGLSFPEKKHFLTTFWRKRELVPASPVSFRVVEHYRRLVAAERDYWFDGVRSYVNSPDRLNYIQFPQFYALNHEFNDKGLIYIRHGEPDNVVRTAGIQVPSNESWLYHERSDRQKLMFHFIIARFATGNNWRLAPSIENRDMLADRLGWDHSISRVYYARSQNELNSTLIEMAEESSRIVETAMTSDSHTWRSDIKPLDMTYQLANFRADDGRSKLVLYTALPLAQLGHPDGAATTPPSIESGSALLNASFAEEGKYYSPNSVADSAYIYAGFYLQTYKYLVEPADYSLSFFARVPDGSKLGGENFTTQVRAFEEGKLDASDLVLAYDITPAFSGGPFTDEGLRIVPNPARNFKTAEPVFIYYEIYNLTLDASGSTSYEIENEIVQLKRKKSAVKKVLGALSSKKKKSVSFKDSRNGDEETAVEHVSFDVANFQPGEYELRVKITDRVSSEKVEKEIKLELVEGN